MRATVVVTGWAFARSSNERGLIVRGRVTDVRAIEVPAGVESVATFAVERVLKGPAGDFVSVRVPGGDDRPVPVHHRRRADVLR